jgi:hypothetical protein
MWLGQLGLTMRHVHKAGDKLFVDYSGKRAGYQVRETGERVEVELCVAVLGPSGTGSRARSARSRSSAASRGPQTARHAERVEIWGWVSFGKHRWSPSGQPKARCRASSSRPRRR